MVFALAGDSTMTRALGTGVGKGFREGMSNRKVSGRVATRSQHPTACASGTRSVEQADLAVARLEHRERGGMHLGVQLAEIIGFRIGLGHVVR